ncbi:SusC/RagA family TonB-linked outer membrane protein [Pedobacter frigiditerrae]|uniref:SusC/RagA family TonB-linked outer membrane protein n=1 Tax=Pedobacter frigiditerrae TaxID=2530452 RepID=UPI00292ED96B|nr:SusC/RagA family TonB-linked outer membrane protein [Pedobacter frigiditerrae]
MKIKLKYFVMFIMLLGPLMLKAQTGGQITVSGVVSEKDPANKDLPVPGVSVRVKGVTTGVMTDQNGRYTIQAPANAVLTFTSIGYTAVEAPLNGKTTLNITIVTEAKSLNDVIIVGYSQQSKAKTTAAVSKLDTKQLENTANASPIAALRGKIAGVSIPVSNGQPGAAPPNIIIRGSSKLNAYSTGTGNSNGNNFLSSDAGSPLVIIDGVFRTLKDINPDDIASMQVMKDAASTAPYGARGANGVIVIATKGGKFNSGKANITFNYRSNLETQARGYDYLNATDYLRLARTTVKNTTDPYDKNLLLNNGGFSAGTRVYTAKGQYGSNINLTALYNNIVSVEGQNYVDNLLANGWMTMDDPANPGTKLLYADNNYQDLLWNTGHSNNYNIGVDGGGTDASYNISLNYVNQEGTFVGTNYKRYSALGNFSFKASNHIQVNAMLNYQNVLPNYVAGYTNDLVRATRITPLIRLFDDGGLPLAGEVLTARNRFHTLMYDDTRVSTERAISRVDADWEIIPQLHFKPAMSYVIDNDKTIFARKAFPGAIQFATSRQKNENVNDMRQLMIDQILQYNFKIKDKHNFMALAGFNYTKNNVNTIDVGTQRATNDYIVTIEEPTVTTVNGAVVTNVTQLGTGLRLDKSASLFGQFNYDFDGKYILSGVLRYDGFSNFAPNNKYALFPSAGLGWNIHRESFWNVKAISTMKLRASWGQAGSRDLSLTDTYGNYNANAYAQSPGILRASLANPNLKWETTETTDIALETSFFNGRIDLTLDWYNKLTKDRLDSKPLPLESPFSSIVYNNGTLQNKGIDIELGATVLKNRDFSWRTNFSFNYNAQKILKLPSNGRDKNRQGGGSVYDAAAGKVIEVGGYAEGERPFVYYAYKVEKVFSTEAEAQAWGKVDRSASPAGITNGKHAGDYQFADLNNDNIIDTRDMVKVGYRTPNKVGGMQNTFTYKNFSMRVNFDFALGHVISDGSLARALGTGRAFNEGAPSEALGPDIWQKPGDEGKKYARFSFQDYDTGQRNYIRYDWTGSAYASDVSTMISKGDYLAFREVYLSYDLPKNFMKKINATGMTLFASVSNIGYLSAYKGLNPETTTGFDPGGYPLPRQFTFGASLRF